MRTRRFLQPLIILAVGIGIGVTVSVILRDGSKEVSAVPAAVSALQLPPTPLPVRAQSAAEAISVTDAHLAMTTKNRRYFIVPGKDKFQGDLCLIVAEPNSAATTCFARTALRRTAAFLFSPASPGTINLAGIAADTFDRASMSGLSTRIVNNVFVLNEVREADHFTLSGPKGDLRVDLGMMRPTSTVTAPTS